MIKIVLQKLFWWELGMGLKGHSLLLRRHLQQTFQSNGFKVFFYYHSGKNILHYVICSRVHMHCRLVHHLDFFSKELLLLFCSQHRLFPHVGQKTENKKLTFCHKISQVQIYTLISLDQGWGVGVRGSTLILKIMNLSSVSS